jgi:hypothetical protein
MRYFNQLVNIKEISHFFYSNFRDTVEIPWNIMAKRDMIH